MSSENDIRIEGPYRHGPNWRCRLVRDGRRVWCRPSTPTQEAALRVAEGAAATVQKQKGLSIEEAQQAFLAQLEAHGLRPNSMRVIRNGLRRMFESVCSSPLTVLTPAKCSELYRALSSTRLHADSHRTYLSKSKLFLSFCVEQKWLKTNPMEAVKGIGRKSKGKFQLRLNEARELSALCLERAAMDSGAAAVLVALWMGLRASEITSRTVRDLDADGTILWVDATAHGFVTKTHSSRRAVQVPDELQPHLASLAKGKIGLNLLFSQPNGKPHDTSWVSRQVHRMCKAASVPLVCAHSLRGLQATTAIHAGATPHLVAQVLGHSSSKMTLQHYAAPGSQEVSDQLARTQFLRVPSLSQEDRKV